MNLISNSSVLKNCHISLITSSHNVLFIISTYSCSKSITLIHFIDAVPVNFTLGLIK